MTEPRKIGVIGIGNMGTPMSASLVRAGYDVAVYDANPDQARAFVAAHGGSAAGSLAELGAHAEVVITMLPTGAVVRRVLLEADGGGLAASLKPGTVVVDMSSSEPTGTRALCAELAARGIALVDAPVSGAVQGAIAGKLTIMIGGDDEAAIERVAPVLTVLGPRHFRTGGSGSGHATKALNNYLSGSAFILMTEALSIGCRFGLDPEIMIDIINESTGRNFATANLAKQHVLSRAFDTKFLLGLMAKDVKIAADLAEDLKAHAPFCRASRDLWQRALEVVGPGADHSAAVKYWEGLNGQTLEPKGKSA
jgi:3-hydroxyisobutyrate dehydrogenase